jgi:hypothetical protein
MHASEGKDALARALAHGGVPEILRRGNRICFAAEVEVLLAVGRRRLLPLGGKDSVSCTPIIATIQVTQGGEHFHDQSLQ